MHQSYKLKKSYPILIIVLCAFFLFYKYILQIYPSVITDQLMQEFQLTGVGLGSLVASFYYAFMVTQLFVGILLDKYSARWITAAAILLCALGVYYFADAHTIMAASLSRALMGIGVAFATVAYMKLAAIWFPPKHYAFIGGLLATAAMAGAVFGEAPLSWLISELTWRTCLYWVSAFGFILAFLFAFTVRDEPHHLAENYQQKKVHVTYADVIAVITSKQNWLLTLYGGLAFCPVAVFGGLWGNPFIQQAYGIDKFQSATLVSLVFMGLGIGSPILGALSSYINDRKKVMFYAPLFSCVMISIVLYAQHLPLTVLAILLFGFGFGLGGFVLVFTVGKELNKASLTATVIAMINASDAVLDAITEPAIGKLLDISWDGKIVNHVHYFSLHSYRMALTVLPIYLLCAAGLLCWVRVENTPA